MKIRLLKQEFFKNSVCMVILTIVLVIYYYNVNNIYYDLLYFLKLNLNFF